MSNKERRREEQSAWLISSTNLKGIDLVSSWIDSKYSNVATDRSYSGKKKKKNSGGRRGKGRGTMEIGRTTRKKKLISGQRQMRMMDASEHNKALLLRIERC